METPLQGSRRVSHAGRGLFSTPWTAWCRPFYNAPGRVVVPNRRGLFRARPRPYAARRHLLHNTYRRHYASLRPWTAWTGAQRRRETVWKIGAGRLGLRFGGAERQLGACSVPLSHLWGPALEPVPIYQTVSEKLDFSHLSQTGWCRSPPIPSKRGHLQAATHPALSDLGDEARSGPKGLIRGF